MSDILPKCKKYICQLAPVSFHYEYECVFACFFQDGEIVYVDWMPQKDQDTGKTQSNMHTPTLL